MYKNIIVGFDNSEFSRAALLESSHWIRRHGGTITLVHAVYFDEEEFAIAPEQREKRLHLGRKVCILTRGQVASEFGFNGNLESLVCEGEPPEVIVDVAEARKADLIALGTHGGKGLKRLLMGSVTSAVIVKASCDVLVVKQPCEECIGKYNSLVVPFDGSPLSKKALDRACGFSDIDGAEITVVYVIPRYEEMMDFFKTASMRRGLLGQAERIMDEASKIAMEKNAAIRTIIEEGNPADKIIENAEKRKSALLVMGTHGWRGMNRMIVGSTAERVIAASPIPVLIVR